jgi:hypothetical protein
MSGGPPAPAGSSGERQRTDATGFRRDLPLVAGYFSEAMSITKRYFTSLFSIRS